jgi:hypothetical protein
MNGEDNVAGLLCPATPLACARFADGADLPMNGEDNVAGLLCPATVLDAAGEQEDSDHYEERR